MKSFISKFNNAKRKNNKISGDKNSAIGLSRHKPAYNTSSLNHAVKRAIKDEGFVNSALETIKPIKFPAYKRDIINYLKNTIRDKDRCLID
jgi:hypothetical protein